MFEENLNSNNETYLEERDEKVFEQSNSDEVFVGFSTGDDELDRLIGGDVKQNDEKASVVVTDQEIDKTGNNLKNERAESNADRKKADDEDYSYYGTIKPLAENAGIEGAKNAKSAKNENKTFETQSAEDLIKAEIEKTKKLKELAKIEKDNQNEKVKAALNAVKAEAFSIVYELKGAVLRVYDEIFKNNPAFKNSSDSIIKNLEEYVQALLLSPALVGENNYECYPEFVYEILPEGDIFSGTYDNLSLNVKMANLLKTQPTATLMFAAVDVSFGRSETKKLIDGIYSLYFLCVTALGQKAPSKDEIMFNMLTFAKNQGVIL